MICLPVVSSSSLGSVSLDHLATTLSKLNAEVLRVGKEQPQEKQMSPSERMRWRELVATLSDIEKT